MTEARLMMETGGLEIKAARMLNMCTADPVDITQVYLNLGATVVNFDILLLRIEECSSPEAKVFI